MLTFGYAWKTEGASGYECFDSAAARDTDLSERLRDSPEPKPVTCLFAGVDGDAEGERALDSLFA